jgi:hypothetical protein
LNNLPSSYFTLLPLLVNRLIAEKLGVSIEDLAPKKDFIKKCLEEEKGKANSSNNGDDDSFPTEKEIREAAKTLASKLDLKATTFKKFVKLLEDEMNCEDLTPAGSTIQKVYDKYLHRAEANGSTSVPHNSIGTTNNKNAHRNVDEVMAICHVNNNNKKVTAVVGKPKCSLDLEQGCKIPEAAGMKWTDGFFDNDTEELVAVFDRESITLLYNCYFVCHSLFPSRPFLKTTTMRCFGTILNLRSSLQLFLFSVQS